MNNNLLYLKDYKNMTIFISITFIDFYFIIIKTFNYLHYMKYSKIFL